jgi:hypothetical protein
MWELNYFETKWELNYLETKTYASLSWFETNIAGKCNCFEITYMI